MAYQAEEESKDSDEEQAIVALMATTTDPESSEEPKDKMLSESESDYDFEEVFSKPSRFDLESCVSEMLEKCQSLQSRYKDRKQVRLVTSETHSELKKDISSLNKKIFSLESNNSALKSKISKLEEEIVSEAGTDCVIRYDRSF